jgi:hypothetical protein
MAAETITVYIDPAQLAAQKRNNYNLYLAKMVNGQFTVIWQSMGPIATVDNLRPGGGSMRWTTSCSGTNPVVGRRLSCASSRLCRRGTARRAQFGDEMQPAAIAVGKAARDQSWRG